MRFLNQQQPFWSKKDGISDLFYHKNALIFQASTNLGYTNTMSFITNNEDFHRFIDKISDTVPFLKIKKHYKNDSSCYNLDQ